MNTLINPLAATLLTVGIGFGFAANAAVPTSSAPSPSDQVEVGSTDEASPALGRRPGFCHGPHSRCGI